jgi:two-component system response regulator HydG
MTSRVLIVDDDMDLRQSVDESLRDLGYETSACESATDALRELDGIDFDVVVTDIRMPSVDGIQLCERVSANYDIPVILMTAFGAVEAAVDGLRASAFDFITKPFRLSELEDALQRALKSERGHRIRKLESAPMKGDFSEIVGEHPKIRALVEHLGRVADADTPVLFVGEKGTGKEMMARAVHRNSPRRRGPFLPVNCAASRETLERELFRRSSPDRTDFGEARLELLAEADGGTLYLDEVGALPQVVQLELLRALQDRSEPRSDSRGVEPSGVRVVAATTRDLCAAVAEGAFREDLLLALDVLRVECPPLRELGDDVITLANHFLRTESGLGPSTSTLSDAAVARLRSYRWPGNVSELRACIAAAAVLASSGSHVEIDDVLDVARARTSGRGEVDVAASLDQVQREHIERVLRSVGGNKAEAARLLGIDRVTLYRRIKKFGPRR